MLALPLLLLFGVAAATDDKVPVSTNHNAANGHRSYTLMVPDGNCANSSDPKISARLDALEKENAVSKLQSRQQELLVTQMSNKIQAQAQTMNSQYNAMKEQAFRIQRLEETLAEHGLEYKTYQDCAEHKLAGRRDDGVYNITLEHALSPIGVWCDMNTGKGGWTLFQRRQDGSVYFFRDWADYKKGFGNVDGEYWLGNDNLYHLTNQKKYLLRVDIWDFDDNHYWAEYDDFSIENELHKYVLHVGKYNGTAGDSLTYHNNMKFSTKYQDNDHNSGDCAYLHKGGFWYNNCLHANLNAIYHNDNKYIGNDAIFWVRLTNNYKALKKTEMKVRPMTYHRK